MSAFYLLGGLLFVFVFALGLPLATALMVRDGGRPASGWLLLAPALGACFYFSVGTILHSFGFRAVSVFSMLMGASVLASTIMLGVWRRQVLRTWLVGAAACFLAAAVALALNTADLAVAGLDYFPLTNEDTFSYLGLIDQLRATGWIEPRISYSAGYTPLIDHAVFTRTAGSIFVADFADILRLETHSAFFLSQRLALPMIALGASAIVMIVTGNWTATSLCFAGLVCGNALLHQILQQFNSSTMGTVIAPVVMAIALWTVRTERSAREMVAGHTLAGWGCGAMAMTSMEAHPFYLIAFGLVAIIPVARDRRLDGSIASGVAFVAAYLTASFPVVIKVWPALIEQFVNAGNGHPGDWIAAPGFLMQATGVTMTTVASLSYYRMIPLITAMAVLITFVISVIVLGWGSRHVGKRVRVPPSDLLSLFLVAVMVSGLQALLYAHGSGYGLLKLTDYFAFLGAVVISVAAYQLGMTESKFAKSAFVGLIVAYCAVAFEAKTGVLGSYRERTAALPPPSAYRLSASYSGGGVYPDLSEQPLNLFLYENRNQAARILFRPSESHRYSPRGTADATGGRDVARMPRVGTFEAALADITYSAETPAADLRLVPAAGQIHLLEAESHWTQPEGETIGRLLRWLSVSGQFVIFGPFGANRSLEAHLAPGPDLRSDNRIEFHVAGQRIQTFAPDQLPLDLSIPLPAQSNLEELGEIRITGPTAGIRQISVAQLRSVTR
jgi:hypothetical protein